MRKNRIIFVVAVLMMSCAGVVIGRLSRSTPPPEHGRGWFHDQLNLSTDQRTKMDAVWADFKSQSNKLNDHKKDLDKDRDSAVRAILTPEQLKRYDGVYDDYRARRSALDQERDKLLHDANDKSRALLTPAQQATWDTMQRDMKARHGPGNDHPATRPVEH